MLRFQSAQGHHTKLTAPPKHHAKKLKQDPNLLTLQFELKVYQNELEYVLVVIPFALIEHRYEMIKNR